MDSSQFKSYDSSVFVSEAEIGKEFGFKFREEFRQKSVDWKSDEWIRSEPNAEKLEGGVQLKPSNRP